MLAEKEKNMYIYVYVCISIKAFSAVQLVLSIAISFDGVDYHVKT